VRGRSPWRGRGRPLGTALLVLCLLAACSQSDRLEKIEQANRVQDQRLKALEESVGEALRKQTQQLTQQIQELQRQIEAQGQAFQQRLDALAAEQADITGSQDKTTAELKRLGRRLQEQAQVQAQVRLEEQNDLDKLRLRMKDVEALLKSPIAGLPATTDADKALREAYYLMVSGQLDLAADKFTQFNQAYPTDRRRAEALFRLGQCNFFLRKYDFALVPLYELIEKHASSKLAVEARWYVARSLEETGDLKLARNFYAQLISGKTIYAADASRRVALINKLVAAGLQPAPKAEGKSAPEPDQAAQPDKPEAAPEPPAPAAQKG